MKIAVASDGKKVAQHFGHCENFNIYDTEYDKIIKAQSVPNPGHRPGFLPNYLHDQGVNVVISGGMGAGAIEIFNEKGIVVVTGATGDAETAAADYLNGRLVSSDTVCQKPEHHGDCGHH